MLSGNITVLLFGGTLLLIALGFVVTLLIIRHNNRLNFMHLEKKQMVSESRKLHIEENERMMNEISKELHDNIGQSAHLVRASLRKAERMSVNPDIIKLIAGAAELTDQIVRDAKNISHSLNQNFIKSRNLHLLLENDFERIKSFSNIDFDVNIIGTVRELSPEFRLIVYRIAQESLHNILKHSEATEIMLTLDYSNDGFIMKIRDNGIGLQFEKIYAREGIGFTNMRERAELLNGEISIDSNPGSGCCVCLVVKEIHTSLMRNL